MYELDQVRDIRTDRISPAYPDTITLICFNDGQQYCSCCGPNAVDYHEFMDETK